MNTNAQDPSLYESMIKLLIVGDPQVGKSSLVARFCTNSFLLTYSPTNGISNPFFKSNFYRCKFQI